MTFMWRTVLVATFFVSLVGGGIAAAEPQAQTQAPPQPLTIIQEVRALIAKGDFAGGEARARAFIAEKGPTGEAIEAFSWLGRGQLAANRLDEALRIAFETERMVEEVLKTRGLDDETHLPLALGASFEVQAQATARQGDLGTALRVLTRNIETYKNTSILARLQKNLNLLTLEGKPAPEYRSRNTSAASRRRSPRCAARPCSCSSGRTGVRTARAWRRCFAICKPSIAIRASCWLRRRSATATWPSGRRQSPTSR